MSSQLSLWVNGAYLAGEKNGKVSVKLSSSELSHPRSEQSWGIGVPVAIRAALVEQDLTPS